MEANDNPLRRIVLCLPHGIIYVLPNICQQCYIIAVNNINSRYFERIRDVNADPLVELEEVDIGNGQYAPALLTRTIHVEDFFRHIPWECTRLGVPLEYNVWSPPWNNFAILRLRIPVLRPMRIEAPRPRIRLYSSMNSPTDTPSRSPSPVPSYSQIPYPESITPSTRD